MSYPGHTLGMEGGAYPSAEMQSVYSTALVQLEFEIANYDVTV